MISYLRNRVSVLAHVSFFKFLVIRSCVGYLIFHLQFLLLAGNFFLLIPVSVLHFYCHYYFPYVYFLDYKRPSLGFFQSSTNNQIYTTHKKKSTMERYLNILEEEQPKFEEIIDEQKLKCIASQNSICDFFEISHSDYLAFSKDEKSRMFKEYYNKLVLKYFGGKKNITKNADALMATKRTIQDVEWVGETGKRVQEIDMGCLINYFFFCIVYRKDMFIPIEMWGLIIRYLPLNDIIEVSCICKDFYCLSRSNSFFVNKLSESRKIFKNKSWISSASSMFCETFYFSLFRKLVSYVGIDHILKIRTIIQKKLSYAILPFCV